MTRVVEDELALLRDLLPLEGARVLDIGCGGGSMTRRLVAEAGAREACGIDLPDHLPRAPAPAGVTFRPGRGEALEVEGPFDVVLMLKSLHHVPVGQMDRALEEAARVLSPGGWLYVSEPLARGDFDAVMRLFHDEAAVRAEAQGALRRVTALALVQEVTVLSPVGFSGFDDFERRMMALPTLPEPVTEAQRRGVRAAYAGLAAADGSFRRLREVRVTLLRKPAG